MDLKQRVIKGAQLLDSERPNWFTQIDTDKLHMSSLCDCILGQVYGDFETGTKELFTGDECETCVSYGFDWFLKEREENGNIQFELERLWKEQINTRLKTVVV